MALRSRRIFGPRPMASPVLGRRPQVGQRKTGKTWAPWRGPAIRHTQRMAKKKGPDGAVGVSQKNWPKNIDGLEVYHPVPPFIQHGAPSPISGQTNKIIDRSLRSSYFLSSDLKTDSKKSSCRLAYPSGSMMVTLSECIGWKQVRFRTFSVRFRTSQCTRKSMTPRRSKYQGLLGSAVSSCCGNKNNEINMMKSYEQC